MATMKQARSVYRNTFSRQIELIDTDGSVVVKRRVWDRNKPGLRGFVRDHGHEWRGPLSAKLMTILALSMIAFGCATEDPAERVDSASYALISCEYGDEAVARYLRTSYGCRMDGSIARDCYDGVASFEVAVIPAESGQPGNYTLLKSAPCPSGAPVCDGRLRWQHAACACWTRAECDITPIAGSVGSD